jgi:hypothetical protein
MAAALAARLSGEADAQITHAYRLVFQREPGTAERAAAARLIATHGVPAFCRALLNANEFIFIE